MNPDPQITFTVEIQIEGKRLRGTVRSIEDKTLWLVDSSGYEVGINLDQIEALNQIDARPIEDHTIEQERFIFPPNIHGTVLIINTGGTISSRISGTSGVSSQSFLARMFQSTETLQVRYHECDPLKFSEDLTFADWNALGNLIRDLIRAYQPDGVVILHGTDTLAIGATFLSFGFEQLPCPVVLTGAQRSSDRPSSDTFENLVGATIFAIESRYAGVFVAMHLNDMDDTIAIHHACRVLKTHASRRSTFRSIGIEPFALIRERSLEPQGTGILLRSEIDPSFAPIEERAGLLLARPTNSTAELELLLNIYQGLVIAGTGFGHVSAAYRNYLQQNLTVPIVLCSQCPEGFANLQVYQSGRELLRQPMICSGTDLLPHVAWIKLCYLLTRFRVEEVLTQFHLPLRQETAHTRWSDL